MSGAGLSFSRILLNLIYIFGVLFALSAFVLTLSSGLRDDDFCDSAIELCLVFYLGGKLILYIFMCERLRAVRMGFIDRSADVLWQRCFWGVVGIFGQIAIMSFFWPIDDIGPGYCAIGLPKFTTIPLLVMDVSCNLLVSAIFFKQAQAVFTDAASIVVPKWFRRMLRLPEPQVTISDPSTLMMAEIIQKTLFVSVGILVSTIVNLVLLFHYNGSEHGWMCFLMCK